MSGGLIPSLIEWLRRLLCQPKNHATRIVIDDGDQPAGDNVMGAPLSNANTRRIDLAYLDDAGKSEKVQKGSVTATSSDPSVAAITVDPSETFATIVPVDGADSGLDADNNPLDVTFSFAADADKGAGVREITGTYSCPIVGQDATSIKATEGGDTAKP